MKFKPLIDKSWCHSFLLRQQDAASCSFEMVASQLKPMSGNHINFSGPFNHPFSVWISISFTCLLSFCMAQLPHVLVVKVSRSRPERGAVPVGSAAIVAEDQISFPNGGKARLHAVVYEMWSHIFIIP